MGDMMVETPRLFEQFNRLRRLAVNGTTKRYSAKSLFQLMGTIKHETLNCGK